MSDSRERDPQTNAPVRDHVYDGIREFDNRLPNWWLWTFYLAMIFSFFYWLSWITSRVMTPDDVRVARAIEQIEAKRMEQIGELDNGTLWAMSDNASFVTKGQSLYVANCQQCHLENLKGSAEGGIGESLADHEWLYGNDAMYVYNIVANGSPDRMAGMQAWMSQLGPQGVSQVVAFVLSHHTPEGMADSSVKLPEGPN